MLKKLLLLALLGPTPSFATTSYTYSFNSRELYEVVIAEGDKGPDLKPGFYKIDPKSGNLTPVLLGQVVGVNRSYKGVLSYVGLNHAQNSPHDVLTLVDGRLALLNFNSNSRSPGSVLQFGIPGKSGVPVVDMLNGKAITMPKIAAVDDIKVHEYQPINGVSDFPKGFRAYIVSVKAPSHLGQGLTFAFVIEGTSHGDKVKVANNHAMLLSYDFLDEVSMAKLNAGRNQDYSPLFFAPLLIENTGVSLPSSEESKIVRLWKTQLDRYHKYIKTDKPMNRNDANLMQLGVPVYDLLQERPVYTNLPVEIVTSGVQDSYNNVGLAYNPFAKKFTLLDFSGNVGMSTTTIGNSQLHFLPREMIEKTTFSDEAIDRDPNNGKFQITPQTLVDLTRSANANDVGNTLLSTKNNFLYFSGGELKLATRRLSSDGLLHVLDLKTVQISPTDKIAMVMLKQKKIGNRTINVFLISKLGARAQKATTWAVAVEETSTMRLLHAYPIYEGHFLSPVEMMLRTKDTDNDPLFDNVSVTQGAVAYLKEKKANTDGKGSQVVQQTPDSVVKKVPYIRILAQVGLQQNDEGPQKYLKSIVDHTLVADELSYREYDPVGAQQDATGFYMKQKGENGGRDIFLPGSPLYSRKERHSESIVHVSDSMNYEISASHVDTYPTIKISLFPFVRQSLQNRKRGAISTTDVKTFQMGVSFTSTTHVTPEPVLGVLRSFELRYPYASLAYTKILQGIKNKSDEFHILMSFREDAKIPGSQNVLMVANGKIHRSDLAKKKITVELSEPALLHRGIIPSTDYKTHLKMDAEGSYYWEVDTSVSLDSPKKVIYKLSEIGNQVRSRSSVIMSLRDADHLKDSEVGLANKGFRRGGQWEVYGRETIRNRVAGVGEFIDAMNKDEYKEKKKEEEGKDGKDGDKKEAKTTNKADLAAEHLLIENFEKYLDEIISLPIAEQNKIRVILVEPALKAKFRIALFKRLSRNDGIFSLRSPKFRFFYAENNLDDIEIADELQYIASVPSDRRRLLYVEPELLKSNEVVKRASDDDVDDDTSIFKPLEKDDNDDPKKRFKLDNPDAPASFTTLLASGGRARTVRGWKRLGAPAPSLPAIVISTPSEWREIQNAPNNRKDLDNGVFDKFDLNFDFLTAAWTLWPPATDRAADEVKALAKAPYNTEEMKVFPTLDETLEKAAKGQMRGKQTIIIVPPELKPIVQKLVLMRWSTPDLQAATPWSYLNRNLALFRITAKDSSQLLFQDNFRAVNGAASSRNAVVISDLETIERMGRPANQGRRSFTIKDPVKTSRGLLDETAEAPSEATAEAPETSEYAEDADEGDETADDLTAALTDLNQSIEDLIIQIQQVKDAFKSRQITVEEYNERSADLKRDLTEFSRDRDRKAQLLSNMESSGSSENAKIEEGRHLPHALWWIAAEGKAIQPKRAKGWNLKSAIERNAATILIGTEEELNRLDSDLSPERKFFEVRSHFDIVRLTPPDEKTKFRLVQALFDREDVRALQLQFVLKNPNGKEPRSQLIFHFFNRVEQIAYDLKMEKTTAFVKAFTVLKNQLTEDLDLRRSRVVDERFLERLFTRVFPMPLNVEILEPNDPLQKLRNVDAAVRGLQKMGYEGSQDLKRRVIENALSQTRPTDTSRPIPNSQIFFGKTSKGKTFLIQTLFKLQDLVEYNPNKASNADADYILINVAKLTADASHDPDKTPVSKMIEYILDLMAQPKGARAHIAFDDFHKAISKEVRQQLFQFIQGLFEAKNGMITVRTRDGKKAREIPVQNLNIYMTLNPSSNEKTRDEYIRPNQNYSVAERLKREVLAAISEPGFQPEESVLARWSDIINIDNFPRSAKVPELGKRVRQHSRGSREMILVEPVVIDSLVSQFPEANARELLAPASSALTSIPAAAEKSRLYIVSLRQQADGKPKDFPPMDNDTVNLQELTASVRKLTQIDPVRVEEPKSMLRYMAFIMQNFRLQIFNNLALEAHMSDTLRLSRPGMINLLKTNFLMGVSTHILDKPQIPEAEMVIRPHQLAYFNRTQTEEFYRHFASYKRTEKYFPINFGQQDQSEFNLAEFIDGRTGPKVAPRTRKEVINQFIGKIEAVLMKLMQQYLRLESTSQIRDLSRWNENDVREWFGHLTENNPDAAVREIMEEMLNVFMDFQVEFNSPDLVDMSKDMPQAPTLYDEVRLFAYMVDRAVTMMPWGTIGKFTFDVVQMSTDFSLGTKTEFKEYIGTHELSPFAITTPEFMTDMMNVAHAASDGAAPPNIRQLSSDFESMCDKLLGTDRSKK